MRQRTAPGYTLVELLMVVAILSIVALVALPVAQRVTESDADVALDEVAQLLRFARDDARRSGEPRLVSCDPGAGTIGVYLVATVSDSSARSTTRVHRPGTTTNYEVTPDAASTGSAMTLVSCSFTFTDNASATSVVFDADGDPVRGIGKGPMRNNALRAGSIVLGAGHLRRAVNLAVTGRITLS